VVYQAGSPLEAWWKKADNAHHAAAGMMRIGRRESILQAMASSSPEPPASTTGQSDLSSRYVLAIVVEVVVLAGLYWLGRHFG